MRVLVPLAFLVLALALCPSAEAHASLARATPTPNGHVDANLTAVTLVFTEDVERSYTSVDVKDLARKSYAAGPLVFDERRDTVHLPLRPLPDEPSPKFQL